MFIIIIIFLSMLNLCFFFTRALTTDSNKTFTCAKFRAD